MHKGRRFLCACSCPGAPPLFFSLSFPTLTQLQSSAWIYRRLCAARSHSRFPYRERDMAHTSSHSSPQQLLAEQMLPEFSRRDDCVSHFKTSQINTLKILGVAIIITWEWALGEALISRPLFFLFIQRLAQYDSSFTLLCGCATFRHGSLGLYQQWECVHEAGSVNFHRCSFTRVTRSFIYFYYSLPTSASCPEGQQYTTPIFLIYLCVHRMLLSLSKEFHCACAYECN